MNLNTKVLDFVQFGGPTRTVTANFSLVTGKPAIGNQVGMLTARLRGTRATGLRSLMIGGSGRHDPGPTAGHTTSLLTRGSKHYGPASPHPKTRHKAHEAIPKCLADSHRSLRPGLGLGYTLRGDATDAAPERLIVRLLTPHKELAPSPYSASSTGLPT